MQHISEHERVDQLTGDSCSRTIFLHVLNVQPKQTHSETKKLNALEMNTKTELVNSFMFTDVLHVINSLQACALCHTRSNKLNLIRMITTVRSQAAFPLMTSRRLVLWNVLPIVLTSAYSRPNKHASIVVTLRRR